MKATLIAGFVLLAFVSKAVAQDELYLENRPYLDFNQFQALVNVNDLSYMENLILAGQTFLNAPSMKRLLPIHKYVVSTVECDKKLGTNYYEKTSSPVDGLALEWQIQASDARNILQNAAKELDINIDDDSLNKAIDNLVTSSRYNESSEWISYAGILLEFESQNNPGLEIRNLYDSGLKYALGSDQGRAVWVEGKFISKCDVAKWVRNKKFGKWNFVRSQKLESLVKQSYEQQALQQNNMEFPGDLVIITFDQLGNNPADQKFIAECDSNKVVLDNVSSACRDKLGLNPIL